MRRLLFTLAALLACGQAALAADIDVAQASDFGTLTQGDISKNKEFMDKKNYLRRR